MPGRKMLGILSSGLLFLASTSPVLLGQANRSGTLRGTVTVADQNAPMHNATVLIVQLGRAVQTNLEGKYEFKDVPTGTYEVMSHLHALTDEKRTVEIVAGQIATLDFKLSLLPVHEEITVTATGREETTFDSLQAVTTLDTLKLAEKNATSLGEVLQNEPGVAKRSFGPGNSRPVLRGFDGDRVMILEDGMPTGTLSSQSGDHAEPMDAATLDRVEIVKGPATLLYGSNAIGGAVNAVTEHHLLHEHAHEGISGFSTINGGTNNMQAGASAGFEYGYKKWLLWGTGGRQVAGDYHSPIERVLNSATNLSDGTLGFGWFGHKPFFNLSYGIERGRFGVPYSSRFEEEGQGDSEVDETFTRQHVRLNAGVQHLESWVEKFRLALNFSRWMHQEMDNGEIGTAFDNKIFAYRGTFEQRKLGRLTGTFGFSGLHRDYLSVGVEALAPPVKQNGVAVFTLQEVDLKKVKFQFGGRLDHNRFDPLGLPHRSFTGFSGAAGVRVPLWKGGAFVTNYTHSYRSPAIEELYNDGPHVGNLAWEIGDPNLRREKAEGVDLSLRHAAERVRAEANFFYYRLSDFVYMALTGEIRDGLRVAAYSQANSRFLGSEARVDVALHPSLWLNLGTDTVDAKLTATNTPLPRIPPRRGRIGFDYRYKYLSIKPELVVADSQDKIYPTETRTPGYTVINLNTSYMIPRAHSAHVFSVTAFNLGNRLYRNHLSFIKDLAPEIGRGVRFTYTFRFF